VIVVNSSSDVCEVTYIDIHRQSNDRASVAFWWPTDCVSNQVTFWQGCARDLFGRDRDETETLQVAETLPRRFGEKQ